MVRISARGWARLGLGAAGVGAGFAGYLRHRREIKYYSRLLRLYAIGRRFAARYPYAVSNVAYSTRWRTRLDVYSPEHGEAHPVIIFVHGGAWKNYHKELFAPAAMKLLPENIVIVIPDYTLYPKAGYAQMAAEVAAATSWTLENIDRFRGDPRRVVLAGHSAGGHLIGLVGLDERYLRDYGHSPEELAGLIGLSGVYDVSMQYEFSMATWGDSTVMCGVMGGAANFAAASPVTYARPGAPPTLLLHGERDAIVPASIGVAFQEALGAAGARSYLKIYPQAGHTDYLLSALADGRADVIRDISDFVHGVDGYRP